MLFLKRNCLVLDTYLIKVNCILTTLLNMVFILNMLLEDVEALTCIIAKQPRI